MSLKAGTRVGPYEIGALLGEGGMGQVYRARDTRLDRDAAVKILPDSFAGDPDRLARFEREAKTLAALNHPHIAAIYGLEEVRSGGPADPPTRALAMELVEGDDLAVMLARGPVPLDEALPMARQIAEALEAAHAQGVIHRDLKPANIKVRPDGTVKVLDFGLAKAVVQGSGIGDQGAQHLANSPTITSPAGMTRAGVILGTAAYMAPEQARGRVVDSRADIWAFGCVLFEMLTGHQAFDGDDIAAVLAKVIEREPDWTRLPPRTPAPVARLLHRALQKDRAKRLQHMGDARLDLDEALNGPGDEAALTAEVGRPPMNAWRRAVVLASTLGVGVAVGLASQAYWPVTPVPEARAVQFDIPVQNAATSRLTLSPDGRYLAYLAPTAQGAAVWLRDWSQPAPSPVMELPNGTGSLMWSRDGRSLLALSTGSLRRFILDTRTSLGQPFSLLSGIGPRIEISEGRFLSSGFADLALKIATQTGVEQALDLDATVGEIRQAAPTDVSDSRAIIYRSVRMDGSSHVCVTHLDSAPPRCVGPVDLDSAAWYANGQLLYARGGSLVARAFDLETVRFTGGEQPIADGLSTGFLGGAGSLTVRADKLAFAVGASAAHLVWKDQSGAETTVKAIASSGNLALSADGRLLLTSEGRAMVLHDLSTGGSSRLGDTAGDSILSPDGKRIAYRTTAAIVIRTVDSPEEQVVYRNQDAPAFTEDWSPDGRWLVVGLRSGGYQAALVPVDGGEPVRFLRSSEGLVAADEFHFSPNGKWIAFHAQSGGRSEVFVVANPPTSQRWQVSTQGGMQARWRPGSNTLHYLQPDGTMMEVAVQPGDTFAAGKPRSLFKAGFVPTTTQDDYRVAPDGRFLLKASADDDSREAIRVIVNWTALLGKAPGH